MLPWLSAGWLAGLVLGLVLSFPAWQWMTLALAAAALTRLARPAPRSRLALWVAMLAFVAAGRAATAIDHTARTRPAALRPGEQVYLQGQVVGLPHPRSEGLSFDLELQGGGSSPSEGRVARWRVVTDQKLDLGRGDLVGVRARWRPATGTDRLHYTGEARAESIMRLAGGSGRSFLGLLDSARRHVVGRLEAVFPEAEASLISGVLLGADEGMPAGTLQAFRATGTAHILAVSGFNVTLVAGAALALFRSTLGARRGAAAAVAAVVAYTLLSGAEPAVVRAAVMAGISLLALRLGRQADGLTSLAAAALLMTAIDPYLIGDLGFQFSFLATLYLVLFAGPLQKRVETRLAVALPHSGLRSLATTASETILVTLLAQAATLPLSVVAFQTLPLTALPANLLILPAQPALMATGAVAAVIAAVSVPAGQAAAWLAMPFATYTLRVAEWFSGWPAASMALPGPAWPVIVLGYLPLVLTAVFLRHTNQALPLALRRIAAPVGLGLLVAAVAFAWTSATDRPDGRLHLTTIPGGDVLVETPQGRFLLLSAPSSAGTALVERHLPRTHRVLDWIAVPGGIQPEPWLRFAPRGFLFSGTVTDESGPAAPILRMDEGTAFELGPRARLEALSISPAASSWRLTYDRTVFDLVTGDADSFGREQLGTGSPTALILAGSGRALDQQLGGAAVPSGTLAVVASPFAGEVMRAETGSKGGPLRLITSEVGWIRLSTDGRRLWITVERPQ